MCLAETTLQLCGKHLNVWLFEEGKVVAWHLVHFHAPGRDTIPAQMGITTALFPGLCHPEQRDSAQVGPVLCGILAARIPAKAVLERRGGREYPNRCHTP